MIIYEVVDTIIRASNNVAKDQQLFSKAIDDGINAVNKLQEAAIHLSSIGEPIVEYVTSFFGSYNQHDPLLFDTYTPNSTSLVKSFFGSYNQHEPLLFDTYTPNSTSLVK